MTISRKQSNTRVFKCSIEPIGVHNDQTLFTCQNDSEFENLLELIIIDLGGEISEAKRARERGDWENKANQPNETAIMVFLQLMRESPNDMNTFMHILDSQNKRVKLSSNLTTDRQQNANIRKLNLFYEDPSFTKLNETPHFGNDKYNSTMLSSHNVLGKRSSFCKSNSFVSFG